MRSGLLASAALILFATNAAIADVGQGTVVGGFSQAGTGRAINPRHYSYNQGFYGGPRSAFFSSGYGGGFGYRGGYGSTNGYQRTYDYGPYGNGPYGRYGYDAGKFHYYPGGHVRRHGQFHYMPPYIHWHDHWRNDDDCDDD